MSRRVGPEIAEGARRIAFPVTGGMPLANLRDTVAPDGVLESVRIRLLGIPIAAYSATMDCFGFWKTIDGHYSGHPPRHPLPGTRRRATP